MAINKENWKANTEKKNKNQINEPLKKMKERHTYLIGTVERVTERELKKMYQKKTNLDRSSNIWTSEFISDSNTLGLVLTVQMPQSTFKTNRP